MSAQPRCESCGTRRARDLAHRYVPCLDHPRAELLEFSRTQERALHYMDRAMREDVTGIGRPLEPLELARWAQDLDVERFPGASREDFTLAALYMARWRWLPEVGEPWAVQHTAAGLFG